MEPVEGELQGLNIGSSNLLALPEPCQWDSDDELLGIGGIKPKSSPIPRRRSSLSCSDDDDSQPPPSSSRRVSFADAFGLSLVSVKQFDTRSLCDPTDTLEVDLKNAKEYFVKLLFALPVTLEELLYRIKEQKVDLESLELLPGTTTLKGTVRVLNICFDKLVYIRTSLDCWSSHFDLLAEYLPESSQGITDCFSFKLTLVPPFGQQGARVDFCIRYETPFGTFWANNREQNFLLFCYEKAKEQDENEKLVPKSCLKPGRHSSMTSTTSNAEEIPEIILNCGKAADIEPVGVKEEKTQEEPKKLKEESIRNCSRRSRRKAARMAKLQQYFAQKDEKDLQQTEKDTGDMNVYVPAIDEAPLSLSTPQTNAISLLAEPGKNDGQKSVVASMDVERKQVPAPQTQKQENGSIPEIQPELITSKSQTRRPALDSVNSHKSGVDSQLLENGQDKETVTSQAVVLRYQTADKSIGKTVEKAWECFEKRAKEKMGSTTDINCSQDKANHVENTLFENNQVSEPSAHHYTFETIVAPLYHQVFERMENDRRRVQNSTSQADKSAGKRADGRLRVVTYTSKDTRSNPEISAKHGNDCHEASKETFRQYLHNTKSTTENALSVPKVRTDRVEDIDFQDDALPDITDNLLDANVSESNADSETQHSSARQPSCFSKQSAIDLTEKTPELLLLQSNRSNDTEYLLHTLHQQQTCTDSSVLPVQSELDLPTIISENKSKNEDRSFIQKSIKTQVSTEINKTQQDNRAQTSEQTLNTCIKCLDESYTPMPDSTLFHSDISSNVTPKMNQSEALSSSQYLTQATTQPQIPASGATVPYLQTTDDANLIEETSNTCQNGESSLHVGSAMESIPSDRNDNVDICEKMENDSDTIHTEISQMSSEETDVDVRQINNNKEHQILLLNIPDKVTVFGELLVKDTAVSNISSNPDNPENASQENVEEDVEETIQVTDPGKNVEQELTNCLRENQSEEVKEIREVEKQLEEKEEKEQEYQVEKEEQENDEELELGSGKFNEGSYLTEDEEEDVKEEDEEKDAEPRENKDKKDLEAEIQEQVTVDGVMSVATLQSITNEDSFIKEVHQHIGQEQQNTCLEQMSEEPGSNGQTVGRAKEIFCEIGSSQQALDVNIDEAIRHPAKEVESYSEFLDKEEDVCCQTDTDHVTKDATGEVDALLEKQESDCLNEQSENIDDSASTESLTDDEMELYLLRLKNTQQTGLKDVISMEKRHSISRSWTISSPMPSISEHTDEDQPNALLDGLIPEQKIKLERDALALSDKEEEVIESNLLWWREFFSSENMAKIMVYTLLFVVFLITSYICDFIACFGLYLIALYWLYFQVQREPLKGT